MRDWLGRALASARTGGSRVRCTGVRLWRVRWAETGATTERHGRSERVDCSTPDLNVLGLYPTRVAAGVIEGRWARIHSSCGLRSTWRSPLTGSNTAFHAAGKQSGNWASQVPSAMDYCCTAQAAEAALPSRDTPVEAAPRQPVRPLIRPVHSHRPPPAVDDSCPRQTQPSASLLTTDHPRSRRSATLPHNRHAGAPPFPLHRDLEPALAPA